jgi:hypothetical protein
MAGAAAGAFGGFYLGAEWLLLNRWVSEQAGDVKGHVEVLKALRAGNAADALEMLETFLDDDLLVLDPEGYRLTREVRAEMHAALRAAQKYRTEQPRKSKRAHVDEMVRNVLQRQYP